jgi:hypothetical protein
VLRDRLAAEYGLPVEFDQSVPARTLISAADRKRLDESPRRTGPASPTTSTAISSISPAASSI